MDNCNINEANIGFGALKTFTGIVISNRMQKTVVVEIKRRVLHPKYRKFIIKRNRFHVHDELNKCKTGDSVIITETRPISSKKHWKVIKILEQTKDID